MWLMMVGVKGGIKMVIWENEHVAVFACKTYYLLDVCVVLFLVFLNVSIISCSLKLLLYCIIFGAVQ